MNRFLSFADSRMSAALERLGRQAEALDFFDEITLFTEHDLSAEFTSRMGRYLTPSCRGFGYWSWKPWSIHHVLQEMEEGDRLLYLDAGCHINANGTDRFREYVNMLDRDSRGMLIFTNGQPEYKWTKGDIFRHFGVSQEDGHITHTQQIAGGHVFLKKNPLTESLIRDWLHVFYDHLHLADNTPSASPNLPGFVENRYDQSIFSILCKLRGITTLDGSETYAENWEQLSSFPFQDRRDMGIPRAGKRDGWKNAGSSFFLPKETDLESGKASPFGTTGLHDVSKRGNLTHHELFSRPFPQLHPENSFPLRLPFPECNDGYLDKLFSFDQECFAFMKANIPPFQNSASALSSADILPPLFTVMLSPESGFPPFIPE